MKEKIMLFLFRFLLRWEGWEPVEDGWSYKGKLTVLGDGSEVARLIMRRLIASDKLKRNIYTK